MGRKTVARPGDSLLSIIVTAKTAFGPSLVYTYPPAPQAVPRSSKPVYPSLRNQHTAPDSDSGSDSDSDDSDSSDSESIPGAAARAEIHLHNSPVGSTQSTSKDRSKSYLGFEAKELAALLCPQRELCDQPFELVVDHLAFVGHPVWVGEDEPALLTSRRDSAQSADGDGGRGRSRSIRPSDTLGSDISLDLSRHDGVEERSPSLTTRSASEPPSPITPKIIDSRSTSHSPTSSASAEPGPSSYASRASQASSNDSGRVTSFNFLVVVDTPPDSHLSSHLEAYYKDVVIPLTANLKALEKKERWLGKEAAALRRAEEQFDPKHQSVEDYLDSLPSISSLARAISHLFRSLKDSMSASISLGRLPVQVLLRGELPFSLSSENLVEHDRGHHHDTECHGDEEEDDYPARSTSPAQVQQQQRPPLFSRMRRRPPVRYNQWETLLLLEDAEDLRKDVSEGTMLWRFLDICDPTLSFGEYEILLNIEGEEGSLQQIVEHLIHWKKARIVDVVSLKNIYALASDFDPSRMITMHSAFARVFPTLGPFPHFLSRIPPTQPFATIVGRDQQHIYLDALIYLMRHSIVEKQRSYIRLYASPEVKQAAQSHWANSGTNRDHESFSGHSAGESSRSRSSTNAGGRLDLDDARTMAIVGSGISASPPIGGLSRSHQSTRLRALRESRRHSGSNTTRSSMSEQGGTDEDTKTPTVIGEPGRPTTLESRWITEMCRDKGKSVVEKFERMVRMMNGQHHLDEIRFRGKLSRKDIKTVLSAFSDHTIIFLHA